MQYPGIAVIVNIGGTEIQMRIGMSLTESQTPQALSLLRDELLMAVDDGFSSAWMANIFGLDALTALAVAGGGIAGIQSGSAVVPTYPRHPARLAQQARRPAPRVVCMLPVCVTDDPDGARARAAKVFEIYGQLLSYRAMLDREGAEGPADVAIVGNEDQVAGQIKALADCGVTDFVAGEYARGNDRLRTRNLLKSLITAQG